MEIVLQETIEPEVVNGSHCHAPAVPVLKEEISNQLELGVIDECDDVQLQEVVTVKKPDGVSSHVCIDTRAINKELIVKSYAPPPPLGRPVSVREIFERETACK